MNQKFANFQRHELLTKFQKSLKSQKELEKREDYNHVCVYHVFVHGAVDTYTPSTIAEILEQEQDNKLELQNTILDHKIKPKGKLKELLKFKTPLLKVAIIPQKIYKRIGKDDKTYKYRKTSQYFLAPLPQYKVEIFENQVYLPVMKLMPNLSSKFIGHVHVDEFEFQNSLQQLQHTSKALELRLQGLLPNKHPEFENYYQDNLEAFLYDTPLTQELTNQSIFNWIKKAQTAITKNQDLNIPANLKSALKQFQTHSHHVFDLLEDFKPALSHTDFAKLSFYHKKYQETPSLIWVAKAYLVWQANLDTILTYYRHNSNRTDLPKTDESTLTKLQYLNQLS